MIDIHAHIYPPTIPTESIGPLLQRARNAGLTSVISVSENLLDARHILRLSIQQQGFLFACAGLHPAQPIRDVDGASVGTRSVLETDLEGVFEFMEENKARLVGIGEVGLDFTLQVLNSPQNPERLRTPEDVKTEQRKVFARQARFAIQNNLALNVHSRSAGHHAITLLEELEAKKVVMHAFDGQIKYVRKALALGYYFSIPTSVVRIPQQQTLAEEVPLEQMLLESDTPCLGPEKGVSNVPSNLCFAAQEIARIKNVDLETVIAMTTENAYKLFPKIRPHIPPISVI
ncbi:putative deoxyribonuclease tatdn3 [Lunasporangiospora selenospora]|uniref:Deoxyribonuclease tatdn3 n=1 Tax=Lunasporangiospora selenospora TaxID=979761 RepID=A0A9P6FWB2_9FUNG|nr:putative deoxyribonuclease tatdn3 [Lunasporangiospora selenospora]